MPPDKGRVIQDAIETLIANLNAARCDSEDVLSIAVYLYCTVERHALTKGPPKGYTKLECQDGVRKLFDEQLQSCRNFVETRARARTRGTT
jgi:hypothetical protein